MRKEVLGRLTALRKKAGLTAKKLSQELGREDTYITRVENGNFFPLLSELEKILDILGSSLEELFYKEFDQYQMDKELVEAFRYVGQKERDVLLALVVSAYHSQKKKDDKLG